MGRGNNGIQILGRNNVYTSLSQGEISNSSKCFKNISKSSQMFSNILKCFKKNLKILDLSIDTLCAVLLLQDKFPEKFDNKGKTLEKFDKKMENSQTK